MIKKIGIVIMVLALGAGLYLVRRNQETRRGAAQAETSAQVLPDIVNTEPGKEVSLKVWVNTGGGEDRLLGAKWVVRFDTTKLSLMGYGVNHVDYELVDGVPNFEEVNRTGILKFATISNNYDRVLAGAIEVANMRFRAKLGGVARVEILPESKLMIEDQDGEWDIRTLGSSQITIKVSGEGEMCGGVAGIQCEPGLTCVYKTDRRGDVMDSPRPDMTGVCRKPECTPRPACLDQIPPCKLKAPEGGFCPPTPTPTPSSGGECGQRCTKANPCAPGLACVPGWWGCDTRMPTEVMSSLATDSAMDRATVESMIRSCPMVKEVIPADYSARGAAQMPPLYGVCRNPSCPKDADCSCNNERRCKNDGQCNAAEQCQNGRCVERSTNPISWKTGNVELTADDFYIEVGGQRFYAPKEGSSFYLNSDPGYQDYTTLEAIWQEKGKEMRWFIYFKSDGSKWWSEEMRTYNGVGTEWEYFTNNPRRFETVVGSSYMSNYGDFHVNNNGQAKIWIKNLKLSVKFAAKDCMKNLNSVTYQNQCGTNLFAAAEYSCRNSQEKVVINGYGCQPPTVWENLAKGRCAVKGCPMEYGDANVDGVVNMIDFVSWKKGYIKQPTTFNVDFNGDGKVDLVDFTYWKKGYMLFMTY